MWRVFSLGLALLFLVGTAQAQDNGGAKVDATMKLVDANRNLAVIAVMQDNGIRIFEISVPPETRFVTPEGKKIKDGLRSPRFQSANNRLAVPVTLQYSATTGMLNKITVR